MPRYTPGLPVDPDLRARMNALTTHSWGDVLRLACRAGDKGITAIEVAEATQMTQAWAHRALADLADAQLLDLLPRGPGRIRHTYIARKDAIRAALKELADFVLGKHVPGAAD